MPKYALYDTPTWNYLGGTSVLDELDDMIRGMDNLDDRVVSVSFDTGVPFKAEIEGARVFVHMGVLMRDFPRGDAPDRLFASFPVASNSAYNAGKKVLADCVLIEFREGDDPLVRSTHVRLKTDGTAEFQLKPDGLGVTTETLADIIRSAEQALDKKLFSHFANT